MDNGVKTIAVVSHPGNKAADITVQLQARNADRLQWKKLPDVHMLGRNTEDEQVTYDYLLGRTTDGATQYPDGILALVNAKELSRQLYLASQLIDLRLPIVLAFVCTEEAKADGLSVEVNKLSAHFGVTGFAIDLADSASVESLVEGMETALETEEKKRPLHWRPSMPLADAYHILDKKWVYPHLKLHTGARLIEGLRLLGVEKAIEEYQTHPAYDELVAHVTEARSLLEEKNENWTMAEVLNRNSWLGQIIASSTTREEKPASKGSFWQRMMGK